jgi:hypothetical protein
MKKLNVSLSCKNWRTVSVGRARTRDRLVDLEIVIRDVSHDVQESLAFFMSAVLRLGRSMQRHA